MESDLIDKILKMVSKKDAMEEADACYLMVIFRKILDGMEQLDQQQFLILRLFCNWTVHIEITNSNSGLRILSAINDALVKYKLASTQDLQVGISKEIGFIALREELKVFFNKLKIDDILVSDSKVWHVFVSNLILIISNVPLAFPELSKLENKNQKIYNKIAKNPIKAGAGVVLIQISNVDFSAFGVENAGNFLCLIIVTEDTTKIVVPMVLVSLG